MGTPAADCMATPLARFVLVLLFLPCLPSSFSCPCGFLPRGEDGLARALTRSLTARHGGGGRRRRSRSEDCGEADYRIARRKEGGREGGKRPLLRRGLTPFYSRRRRRWVGGMGKEEGRRPHARSTLFPLAGFLRGAHARTHGRRTHARARRLRVVVGLPRSDREEELSVRLWYDRDPSARNVLPCEVGSKRRHVRNNTQLCRA